MINTYLSPWPSFTSEEADAVKDVLLSNQVNYWTGNQVRQFEKEFAAWVGVDHAVALANGTIALDVSLKALGIGAGDEVVVTPRTFIASVSSIVNVGAIPVFADVEQDSGNISAKTISSVLTARTKAVICVHLAGWPCDMDPIMLLAKDHNLIVIEDCAQAHGARYKGRSVGSIGHVGAWSFCQDKIMTTGGEGGMVTTNSLSLWNAMWSLKDHGKSFEAVNQQGHPPGFRWLHESFGGNGRMLEMQAAIGRIQLRRMDKWTAERRANASTLSSTLAKFCGDKGIIDLPNFACGSCSGACDFNDCQHANYKFYAYVRVENLSPTWSRDRIIEAINLKGIPCYQGSSPEVYLEKAFDGTGWRPAARLPVAKHLGETSLMFLVHPSITESEMSKACQVIASVLLEASTK